MRKREYYNQTIYVSESVAQMIKGLRNAEKNISEICRNAIEAEFKKIALEQESTSNEVENVSK